jgi:hypothetical protein
MDNQHKLIKGHRDLSQAEIDLMNEIKAEAERVGALVDRVHAAEGIDRRWAAIARTDLQQGFMALTRSVARPGTF